MCGEVVVFVEEVIFQVEVGVDVLVEVDLGSIEVVFYLLWMQVDFSQGLVVWIGGIDVVVQYWEVVVVVVVVVVVFDVEFVYDDCGLDWVFVF